jgi:predicted TPR repeat methyltransferase
MRKPKGLPKNPADAARANQLLVQLRQLATAKDWKAAAPLSMALVNLAPELADAHDLMGEVAQATGAIDIAETCFARAVSLGPITADRLLRWAKALALSSNPEKAEATLQRALVFRPGDPTILCELGDVQLALGKAPLALKSFEAALRTSPDHAYARHMATALAGSGHGNDNYVAALFDGYADYFDEHLTGKLHYRVPEALVERLGRHRPVFGNVLDVGCGTGLVGAALGQKAAAIDGIDLAPKMVEKARARGIYRHLTVGEATTVISTDPVLRGPYDLVIAADVFIYVGAIESLLAAMVNALASDGLIAFSVETSRGQDVEIRPSGRFAHSDAYIAQMAALHGLVILERSEHDIRSERDRPISGALYILAADRIAGSSSPY